MYPKYSVEEQANYHRLVTHNSGRGRKVFEYDRRDYYNMLLHLDRGETVVQFVDEFGLQKHVVSKLYKMALYFKDQHRITDNLAQGYAYQKEGYRCYFDHDMNLKVYKYIKVYKK